MCDSAVCGTVADFVIVALMCSFPIVSRALTVASCTAWLLEQPL